MTDRDAAGSGLVRRYGTPHPAGEAKARLRQRARGRGAESGQRTSIERRVGSAVHVVGRGSWAIVEAGVVRFVGEPTLRYDYEVEVSLTDGQVETPAITTRAREGDQVVARAVASEMGYVRRSAVALLTSRVLDNGSVVPSSERDSSAVLAAMRSGSSRSGPPAVELERVGAAVHRARDEGRPYGPAVRAALEAGGLRGGVSESLVRKRKAQAAAAGFC